MKPITAVLMCLFLLAMLGCNDDNTPTEAPDASLAKLTCIECHTDQAKLTALATPEPPPDGEAGEG